MRLSTSTAQMLFAYVVIHTKSGNDYIRINGYLGEEQVVEFPSAIGDIPVVEIGAKKENWGFDFRRLKKVIIPDGVKCITNNAFADCDGLVEVILPETLTIIGDEAFRNCQSLKSLELPSNLLSIGDNAFKDCKCLEIVIFPLSIKKVGKYAFSYCDMLKKVHIRGHIKSIERHCFEGCKALTDVLIECNIKTIDTFAFAACCSLKTITLPRSLETISDEAFYDCESLSEIYIPQKVKNIGKDIFRNCTSLEKINVDKDNETYCSIDDVLYSKNKDVLIACPPIKKSIRIPDEVRTISTGAFEYNLHLKSVRFPDSISQIGEFAFHGSNIEEISIKKICHIGDYAFAQCKHLMKITIPYETDVATNAFYQCDAQINFS